jgi:hypothetical protein
MYASVQIVLVVVEANGSFHGIGILRARQAGELKSGEEGNVLDVMFVGGYFYHPRSQT